MQSILDHKCVDITLGYARLYGGTVAADYYRALAEVESRRDGGSAPAPPDSGQLLALADSLRVGTLNDTQRETVQALCAGILATFASLPSEALGTSSAGMAEGGNGSGSAGPKAT